MYEALQTLGWVGNIICLTGSYRIAHQKRDGYLFFLFSCLFLLPAVIYGRVWNQALLEFAFMGINILGWIKWGKNGP
jgi:hypothetical protein